MKVMTVLLLLLFEIIYHSVSLPNRQIKVQFLQLITLHQRGQITTKEVWQTFPLNVQKETKAKDWHMKLDVVLIFSKLIRGSLVGHVWFMYRWSNCETSLASAGFELTHGRDPHIRTIRGLSAELQKHTKSCSDVPLKDQWLPAWNYASAWHAPQWMFHNLASRAEFPMNQSATTT